ncbi:MAG TPA: CapA family protein [Solirubrobacterales bacterium]|nr:CapA family protein [Solirubrobacterales bacterium]
MKRLILAVAAVLLVAAPASAARAAVPKSISIAAVGDTILGNTPQLPGSPAKYFRSVAPRLQGDVVFGNLEGTLTNASASKCGAGSSECFAFRNPPRFARAFKAAGFTVMNHANNHFGDFGRAGEADTIRALRRAGITQSGRPADITVIPVKNLRVAFLGFAPYDNTPSLLDLPVARNLIEVAASLADIVVVAIHAGAEGSNALHVSGHEEHDVGEDRGNPERFAHMAVHAGADLVLGSGPHVLRGMEIFHRRLIAYSLGNFAGFHNFNTSGVLSLSAILHVSLDPHGRFRSGRITSVRLAGPGRPVPDRSDSAAHLIRRLSRADFGRVAFR